MLYLYYRSITTFVQTILGTSVQRLKPGLAMERLRKRKGAGSGVHILHTSSAPPGLTEPQAAEGRSLRSKSGRKISETVLADALAQSTSLENRGLEKKPSGRTHLSKGSGQTDQKAKKPARKPAARVAAESEALGSGAEPSVIAEQTHVPAAQACPGTPQVFPVWTEAELEKASQHLCEVDPCECSGIDLPA